MYVISRKKLREFEVRFPEAGASLTAWRQIAEKSQWNSLVDAKREWGPSTDYVNGLTVFNISGNKYRLIAFVDYQAQVVLIRAVLTHRQYDTGDWKNDKYYRDPRRN